MLRYDCSNASPIQMFIDVSLKLQIAVANRSNFCLNCWSSMLPQEGRHARYALTTCETAAKSLARELDPLLKHSNMNRALCKLTLKRIGRIVFNLHDSKLQSLYNNYVIKR